MVDGCNCHYSAFRCLLYAAFSGVVSTALTLFDAAKEPQWNDEKQQLQPSTMAIKPGKKTYNYGTLLLKSEFWRISWANCIYVIFRQLALTLLFQFLIYWWLFIVTLKTFHFYSNIFSRAANYLKFFFHRCCGYEISLLEFYWQLWEIFWIIMLRL